MRRRPQSFRLWKMSCLISQEVHKKNWKRMMIPTPEQLGHPIYIGWKTRTVSFTHVTLPNKIPEVSGGLIARCERDRQ